MVRQLRTMAVAGLAAIFLVTACAGSKPLPGPAEMAAESGRLDQVVPLLGELGVTAFTAEGGCAWIIYARGGFFDGGEGCQPGDARPFDDVARVDHARVLDAIEAANAPSRRMSSAIGPDGRLRTARFLHAAHPYPDYWEYVYDPDDVEPKVDGGPLEFRHIRLNAGWWFVSSLDD